VLSNIECWPEWTPTVMSIERLDRGTLAVGSRARIRQPKLPPAVWQITELDAGRSFTWVTRSPGVRVTARHWVEAREGGSRATLSAAPAPGGQAEQQRGRDDRQEEQGRAQHALRDDSPLLRSTARRIAPSPGPSSCGMTVPVVESSSAMIDVRPRFKGRPCHAISRSRLSRV
jgi:hypothetical protein